MHPVGQALIATGKALPWSPLVVVPATWLEGDGVLGVADAGLIATWNDLSPAGNSPTGATSSVQPTLRTNALNAYPVVEFDGATDILNFTNFMSTATEATLFAVVKNNADPGNGNGFIDFGTDTANQDHYPYTDGNIYSDFGSNARKTVGNPTPSMAAWHMISMRSASGAWDCRFNGTSLFTTASNTVAFNTLPRIGTGGGVTFGGRVAMFLVNQMALTDAYVEKLEGYAAHKYALQSVLPAGHTWKNIAPPYEPIPTIAVRMSQQFVEVINSGNPKVRLSQHYVEVPNSGFGKLRVSQQYIEVITNN